MGGFSFGKIIVVGSKYLVRNFRFMVFNEVSEQNYAKIKEMGWLHSKKLAMLPKNLDWSKEVVKGSSQQYMKENDR